MDKLLPVARYSGDDETGSMDRQVATLEAYVAEASLPVAGWVKDETVSGAINLDERKSLGQWLGEPKRSEWTVMAVTTQDRVTRDDLHWWIFVGKLIQWGKRLVVLDDPALDLSTPNGRLIAGVKATQAANYRLAVKEKILEARKSHRQQRRFTGGHWPFGYRAEPIEGAEGWRLVVDPVTSKLLREAAERMLALADTDNASDSLRAIARDWRERGVPTARQHQAMTTPRRPGKPKRKPKNYVWIETTLGRILRNPECMGYKTFKGELIREDGIPVQWADPILTPAEFFKLQEVLNGRARKRSGVRTNRSALLGVAFCVCGKALRPITNKAYRYYRCASGERGPSCEWTRNWPIAQVHGVLEENFLTDLGVHEMRVRIFVPGENHEAEIASLSEAIEHLAGNLAALPADSRAARSARDALARHEKRLDELEAAPTTPDTYRYEPTGQTFAERWLELDDWSERGAWLLRIGVRIEIGGTKEAPSFALYAPRDLVDRAGTTAP